MPRPSARRQALDALYRTLQLPGEPLPETGLGSRARRLVEGVLAHAGELDQALGEVSQGWRVERMPPIDRSILRLALYELRYLKEVPKAVVISEAVKLAKRYSTGDSGTFVNGVLATLEAQERT